VYTLFNKKLFSLILSFFNEKSQELLKKLFKKGGAWKDRKKKIKQYLSNIIKDFGEKNDKVQYIITQNKSIIVRSNIFNFKPEFLKEFIHLYIRKSNESLDIDKEHLYKYLKVLPQHQFELANKGGDTLEVQKIMVPYSIEEGKEEEEKKKI
jgi:NADH:ubiquinone oxidoreductase subunit D